MCSYVPSGNILLVRPNANANARSSNACLAGDRDPMKFVRELVRDTVPRVSQGNLIGKRVLCLRVKSHGVRVDNHEVGRIFSRTRPGEIGPQSSRHQFVTLRRTGRTAVQGRLDVLGQSNKGFNVHGVIVRPSAHAMQAAVRKSLRARGDIHFGCYRTTPSSLCDSVSLIDQPRSAIAVRNAHRWRLAALPARQHVA